MICAAPAADSSPLLAFRVPTHARIPIAITLQETPNMTAITHYLKYGYEWATRPTDDKCYLSPCSYGITIAFVALPTRVSFPTAYSQKPETEERKTKPNPKKAKGKPSL